MTNLEQRIKFLEMQVAAQAALIQSLQAQTSAAQQQARTTQQSPYGGSGGAIYTIAPVVIGAGGNATGLTVYFLLNGTSTALGGTFTVYNQMQKPTSNGAQTILVAPNGDGSFTVVTQSC